jgi:threonine/homoserine/homoserine lactone efflux protein
MSAYLLFFLAFASSAAVPGPEIAALLSRSLSHGMRSSLPLAGGIICGKLVMLTTAVLGLAMLLHVLGPAFGLLKWAGVGYLLYLGINKWRKAGQPLATTQASLGKPSLEFGLGMAMTLSNPLALAFYMALLPNVIPLTGIGPGSYLLLCGIIIATMLLITLGYGLLAEASRAVFRSPRAKANIDRGSGCIMLGVALLLASR